MQQFDNTLILAFLMVSTILKISSVVILYQTLLPLEKKPYATGLFIIK